MNSAEYETIQDALRKKLHRRDGYMGNKEEIYREGIRAAMSILSSHQKRYSGEWVFAGYGLARCSKCKTEIPYNTPMPQTCPICGVTMRNTHF